MDKEESSKVEDKGQNMYEMKCKLNCYQPLTLSGAGKVQALATQMT